jgi:hypothetical protein
MGTRRVRVTLTFPTPILLLTRTLAPRDADGNDTYTTVQTVTQGAFDPGGSTELVQGQDLVITQPTVLLPPGTAVGPLDAVSVAGVTYEVDGSPNAYTSPFTGWQPGVVVKLRAVTG